MSSPYDLIGAIFFNMIGIYKITNPSNKVYIGQSIDIEKRFRTYERLECKKQIRLYNSLKKHGFNSHKFEVICQCSIEELNEMERFYQDAFCSTNENGLNCRLTVASDRVGKLSDEAKAKISKASKNRSEESRAKIINAIKNRSKELIEQIAASNRGKKRSLETRIKISESHKNPSSETRAKISYANRNRSSETRAKLSAANKGKKASIETRQKMSISQKNMPKEVIAKRAASNTGKKRSLEIRERMSIAQSYRASKGDLINGVAQTKIVLHLITGVFFDNARDAANCFGYKYGTFTKKLSGFSKNTTNCIYV